MWNMIQYIISMVPKYKNNKTLYNFSNLIITLNVKKKTLLPILSNMPKATTAKKNIAHYISSTFEPCSAMADKPKTIFDTNSIIPTRIIKAWADLNLTIGTGPSRFAGAQITTQL